LGVVILQIKFQLAVRRVLFTLFSLSLSHWKRFCLVCTARSAT